MEAFDLIVIGSGTAAQVAAGRVRKAGRSVAVIDHRPFGAVIDHRPFGGTCALRGCDPKKMLVSGAEALDLSRRMRGGGVAGDLRMGWKDLIAFKLHRSRAKKTRGRLRAAGHQRLSRCGALLRAGYSGGQRQYP